jgi:hypothetical protein
VAADPLIFRLHAIQRMFLRQIGVEDVRYILASGEIIKEYPDDTPYPSRLVLGWIGTRPIHVVAARDAVTGETIVITVYEPDRSLWDSDFKGKRS